MKDSSRTKWEKDQMPPLTSDQKWMFFFVILSTVIVLFVISYGVVSGYSWLMDRLLQS